MGHQAADLVGGADGSGHVSRLAGAHGVKPATNAWRVRFLLIGESTMRLIVPLLAADVYLSHDPISSHSIAGRRQTACTTATGSIP